MSCLLSLPLSTPPGKECIGKQGRNWSAQALELADHFGTGKSKLHAHPVVATWCGCLRFLKPQKVCYSALLTLLSVDSLSVNSSVSPLILSRGTAALHQQGQRASVSAFYIFTHGSQALVQRPGKMRSQKQLKDGKCGDFIAEESDSQWKRELKRGQWGR